MNPPHPFWTVPCSVMHLFFFKQKTAYEITYGDWSSDVCSSDLPVQKFRMISVSRWSILPARTLKIGRAHVGTPVTVRNLVCRLLLDKKIALLEADRTHKCAPAATARRGVAPPY